MVGRAMARSIFQRSNLEQEVANILDELGIEYTEQFPTRSGFNIDFVIHTNEGRVALEIDGPYHDDKKQRKKDGFRTQLLKKEGWQVYRVHHSEFGDLERLRDRIRDRIWRS